MTSMLGTKDTGAKKNKKGLLFGLPIVVLIVVIAAVTYYLLVSVAGVTAR